MVYSSVSSTKQMSQVSHRVEIKKRSISLLAQGHTKDDDQQDQNHFPKQVRSAGVGHCYRGTYTLDGVRPASSSGPTKAGLSAAGLILSSWHHKHRLFCLASPVSHSMVCSTAVLQNLDLNAFCQLHLSCDVYIKLKEEESPFGNKAYCFFALFEMPQNSVKFGVKALPHHKIFVGSLSNCQNPSYL